MGPGPWGDPEEEATRPFEFDDATSAFVPAAAFQMDWDDEEYTTRLSGRMQAGLLSANLTNRRREQIAQHFRDQAALHTPREPAQADPAGARQPSPGRPSLPPMAATPPQLAHGLSRAALRPNAVQPQQHSPRSPVLSPVPAARAPQQPAARVNPVRAQPMSANRTQPQRNLRAVPAQPKAVRRQDANTYHPQPAPPVRAPQPAPTPYLRPVPQPRPPSRVPTIPLVGLLPSQGAEPPSRTQRISGETARATPAAPVWELPVQAPTAIEIDPGPTLDLEDAPWGAPKPGIWSRSVLPGLALLGAVFMGRVLLHDGALPAAAPAASVAAPSEVRAPEPSPEPAPSAEPAQAIPEITPAPLERTKSRTRSGVRRNTANASAAAVNEPEPVRERASDLSAPTQRERNREVAERQSGTDSDSDPGMLRINSRPWAKVFVDGKLVGTTPQMALTLSAGQHSIELVNPELDMRKTLLISVEPGQVVTKVVNLIE